MNSRPKHLVITAYVAVLYLILLSLIILKSIDLTTSLKLPFSFNTQVLAVIIGLVVGAIIYKYADYVFRFGGIIYVFTVILLFGSLFVSSQSGLISRQIKIAGIEFQPVETVKMAVVLYVAKLLVKLDINKEVKNYLSLLIAPLLTVPILVTQPDLGSAVIVVMIWLTMLFSSATIPKKALLAATGLFIAAGLFAYPMLADYQQRRIEAFLNPSLDVQGSGYNALQATIAIGNGGLTGKGLDSGSQSQLNFLPSQQTDFIFAVTAEKMGFIGASTIIIAFTVLTTALMVLVREINLPKIRYVITGYVAALMFQFIVNVGMNLNLAPVTGVVLPFVSAGGSHIVFELAALGMIGGLVNASGYKGNKLLYRS